MKRLLISIIMVIVLLFTILKGTIHALEYQFSGHGINGYPFQDRNTGLLSLEGEPPVVAYCMDMNTKLIEGAFYTSEACTNNKIKAIVNHSYPVIKDINTIKNNANLWLVSKCLPEIAELNIETVISATQIAIWNIENSLDIGSLDENTKDEVKLAHYLTGIEYMEPIQPEIIIKTTKTADKSSETYNATFTYYLSKNSQQALINKTKSKFSNLPAKAVETLTTYGDKYIRTVSNIDDERTLSLTVHATKTFFDIQILSSDDSQKLVGMIERTMDFSKSQTVYFSKIEAPSPTPVGNTIKKLAVRDLAPVHKEISKNNKLPIEVAFGLVLSSAAVIGLFVISRIKAKKRKN